MHGKPLVLASASPYRAELLRRLGLPFATSPPDVDESPQAGEPPGALVTRLALAKASKLATSHAGSLIIGSDQVGELEDRVLGKPADLASAVQQLLDCSGKTVTFHTGLCLLDSDSGHYQLGEERFFVTFRDLESREVESYVDRERPLDCAGSFRVEGPGIALFARLQGEDPTSLQGLPLIRLCTMLRAAGVNPLVPD